MPSHVVPMRPRAASPSSLTAATSSRPAATSSPTRASSLTPAAPTRAHVVSRVLASSLGSYGFVWGLTSLGTLLGVAAGLPYSDAQSLLYLIVFVVFVVCGCWALSAQSLARVWLTLAGGGAVMTAVAWLWARALT